MAVLSATMQESGCPLDCPDACSLSVTVADGRVVTIDGSHSNPVTRGYICAKVRGYTSHLYGPERLLYPAVRRGRKGEGRFERATWDEALALIAERLHATRREWGGEAILPLSYGGSNGYLSQDTTDARLFRRLGASRLLRTVCAMPTGRAAEGLYGDMAGVAYPDYAAAGLIVIWGANPSVGGIHLVPYVQEAQKKGARLVVIDPRRTPLARRADSHLALRPGTDLGLALAIVRWLFENDKADTTFLARHTTGADELRRRAEPWTLQRAAEVTGLPADDIEAFAGLYAGTRPAVIRWLFANDRADTTFLARHTTGADELRRRAEPWTLERAAEVTGLRAGDIEAFARLYAGTRPAVIRCGWGLERNRNGGSAAAAVLALPAVAGTFGERGGGYTLSNSAVWDLNTSLAAAEPEPATRAVNMNQVGAVLTGSPQPPVKLLFVYDCNPLMTLPAQERVREGLQREDLFTVVFDQVLTDTARYADVVLPAATFLERREISRGYGAYALQDRAAVITPVGESRANHEVFGELCALTGVSRPGEPTTTEELAEAIYRSSARRDAIRAGLAEHGVAFPPAGPRPVQFVDVFPGTPDGKAHLVPADLDREAPEGLYAFRAEPKESFPLALISPSTDKTISSTLGQLRREHVPVDIHPDDASARGISDGDRVRLHNSLGEVRCRARVTADVRPGVVSLPKGLWSHNTESGTTANALCPDTLADLGGGACFNDARIEVERISR